jgi:cell shape-determining protein MreC
MSDAAISLLITIAVNLVTIGSGVIGFIALSKKLPGELENQRIKNAKEKSEALEKINEDAEKAFISTSDYRRKFQEALIEIDKLKTQIASLPELIEKVAFLECEQENYKNENAAYRLAYENTCAKMRKHGEEPYPLPYIRKKDCAELVKGNGHVE